MEEILKELQAHMNVIIASLEEQMELMEQQVKKIGNDIDNLRNSLKEIN